MTILSSTACNQGDLITGLPGDLTRIERILSSEVAVICPTPWDRRQIARLEQSSFVPYGFSFFGADTEANHVSFDPGRFIEHATVSLDGMVDGIASTSDYPGSLASSTVAERLRMRAPSLSAMVRSSDKYLSRQAQREAVPEATPEFALVHPEQVGDATFPLRFPVFAKPVKSSFSRHARVISNLDELRCFANSSAVHRHHARYAAFDYFRSAAGVPFHDGVLIVEEVLRGRQATLEVYVFSGQVVTLGVVDSLMYAGTNSFERFDYPSRLPFAVWSRMREVVERYVHFIGFDQGLMNVEFFYDETRDDLKIVEVNPRMSPQFAELFGRVGGANTYHVLGCLALGIDPLYESRDVSAASSFVLRSFSDGVVRHAPSQNIVEQLEKQYDALIMTFYTTSERLGKDEHQCDGPSFRYCVINMAAQTRADLQRQFELILESLAFNIETLPD